MNTLIRPFLVAALMLSSLSAENAIEGLRPKLGLPFTDHAILQQKMPVPVWGSSWPGAQITVEFNGQTKTTKVDGEGKWRLSLDAMDAIKLKSVNDTVPGKAMTITANRDGKSASVALNDLVVGDVWICAGQSNMAGAMRKPVHAKNYPADSIPKANYPSLRHYSAKEGKWLVCTPETAVGISRVTFFFIRRVQQGCSRAHGSDHDGCGWIQH